MADKEEPKESIPMEQQQWLNRRVHGEGVVELELGHAPQNTLSVEFLMDFQSQISLLEEDPEVKSIVLTSPFKDFSTGTTSKDWHQDSTSSEALERALNAAFLTLFACPKPVVCVARGEVLEAGMFFVLASDIRVAHARAAFEMSDVSRGQIYPVTLMEIARATLDPQSQRRLMLGGQRLGPISGRHAGFIDVIADDYEDLIDYALKEARKLANLHPESYAQVKMELRQDALARIAASLSEDPEIANHWLPHHTGRRDTA